MQKWLKRGGGKKRRGIRGAGPREGNTSEGGRVPVGAGDARPSWSERICKRRKKKGSSPVCRQRGNESPGGEERGKNTIDRRSPEGKGRTSI